MNTSHFLNEDYKEQIEIIWKAEEERLKREGVTADVILRKCLRIIRRFDRDWGKKRADERRKKIEEGRASLAAAQLDLQSSPQDPQCQARVFEAEAAIHEIDLA